tara:strand:+ start:1231 stop:2112 length:882 start_codon:yes stop_codon:yes gene_type:complete
MQTAPIPHNETIRLDAVHRLQVLDTSSEEQYDRITRIAHHLFDVPSAFITLVDSNRVWFKSVYGCELREEPRDVSFCGHTINNMVTENFSSRIFEVQNAKQDDRFYDNSFIIEKCNARYYMGFVLQSKDKCNIGTLCITDTRPRIFSEDQKKLFSDLGFMAEQELNTHRVASDEHANKLQNLSNTLGTVQKLFNDSLKKHDTNYKEWCVLNAIMQSEAPTPRHISQMLCITPPLISRKLEALEIKRLIERCYPKDGDRRFVQLTCSNKGKILWKKGLQEANRLGEVHLKNIIC